MSSTPKPRFRLLKILLVLLLSGGLIGAAVVAGAWFYITPRLPDAETLRDVVLQVPLRVFTRDGKMMAEIGEKRRTPVRFEEVPKPMIQAFLAAEDDRFFEHPGVDWQGLARAAVHLLRTGEKGQGGSTITMQVARNFFLSREKTYLRKLNEIFLSFKIERDFTKEEILELYLNKIYLGHRAYGVQAAAEVYYGKPIQALELPQIAMIAALPKAPSSLNPVTNPRRAVQRRNYVLGRMRELGFIDEATYQEAIAAPVTASLHGRVVEVEAPYIGEMVRAYMVEHYGMEAYTNGYRVYTTIDSTRQQAATRALRRALLAYDRRHGWRGAVAQMDEATLADERARHKRLREIPVAGGLVPAVITSVEENAANAYTFRGNEARIEWEGIAWARPYIDVNLRGPKPERAGEVLQAGDIVYLEHDHNDRWLLAQIPEVSGALVSIDPRDGAIQALEGGFDYYLSKFNRAIQAERQPGSNFKPFIYTAALAKGYTPASIINDAPVVFEDPALENTWRPENYSGKFYGPTRLREALVKSRNLVSIRLLRSIGVDYAIDYISRFGFAPEKLPHNLSLALGSVSVTPLQLATAYAVFANGGFRVESYLIERIEDASGNVLFEARPKVACPQCEEMAARATATAPSPASSATAVEAEPAAGEGEAAAMDLPPEELRAPRVVSARNVYLITSMMRDVVKRGTGRRAMVLGRHDLAGKTGTTNDQKDAWFSGFNPDLVATTWVGFDQIRTLGAREVGGRAALPMWIDYMRVALDGIPERPLEMPPGLVTVRIDAETGLLAGPHTAKAVFETFPEELVPPPSPEGGTPDDESQRLDSRDSESDGTEQIF